MRGFRDVCEADTILSNYFGDKPDRENAIARFVRKHFRDFIHPVKLSRALGAAASATGLHPVGRGFESLSAHH